MIHKWIADAMSFRRDPGAFAWALWEAAKEQLEKGQTK